MNKKQINTIYEDKRLNRNITPAFINRIHPSNQIIVNSISDLPAPVAGVITLENFNYIFNGFIAIPYTLAPPVSGIVNLAPAAPGNSR